MLSWYREHKLKASGCHQSACRQEFPKCEQLIMSTSAVLWRLSCESKGSSGFDCQLSYPISRGSRLHLKYAYGRPSIVWTDLPCSWLGVPAIVRFETIWNFKIVKTYDIVILRAASVVAIAMELQRKLTMKGLVFSKEGSYLQGQHQLFGTAFASSKV